MPGRAHRGTWIVTCAAKFPQKKGNGIKILDKQVFLCYNNKAVLKTAGVDA